MGSGAPRPARARLLANSSMEAHGGCSPRVGTGATGRFRACPILFPRPVSPSQASTSTVCRCRAHRAASAPLLAATASARVGDGRLSSVGTAAAGRLRPPSGSPARLTLSLWACRARRRALASRSGTTAPVRRRDHSGRWSSDGMGSAGRLRGPRSVPARWLVCRVAPLAPAWLSVRRTRTPGSRRWWSAGTAPPGRLSARPVRLRCRVVHVEHDLHGVRHFSGRQRVGRAVNRGQRQADRRSRRLRARTIHRPRDGRRDLFGLLVAGQRTIKGHSVHRGTQYVASIRLTPGRHKLTVKVKFTASSQTHALRFRRNVRGCSPAH